MFSGIRVLHVDDDQGFSDLTAAALERADERLDVVGKTNPESALDYLETEPVDCVVSDYDVPGMDGLAFLDAVREVHPDVPFILFTGKGSEEVASEAISAGITDYLQKDGGRDQYAILANRIVDAVGQRESENSYREIFENAADGIFVHDPETGAVNDVNPRAAELLGYDREELIDMDVGEFSADDPRFSQANAEEKVRLAIAEGAQTFEWLFQAKSGEEFWIEAHLKPTVIDGNQQVIAMTRDISERKAREHRLQNQKEKVEALHAVAADIEASQSADEVYDHVFAAADEILDFDRGIVDVVEDDKLVPKKVPAGVADEEYHEETPLGSEDSLAARAVRTGESILVDDLANHDVAPAEPDYRSAITVPIDEFGMFQAVRTEPSEFDETDLELTELLTTHASETLDRLEYEAELRSYAAELERQNDRLEEFASVVSHDLRSPLNVVSGRINLAREEHDDTEHLDAAADALDRMDTIIEHTLALARQGQAVGETKQVDLATMAEQSWDVVDTSEATLVVEDERRLRADPDRFRQLLENLFRNSIDHGGEDVTVTVGPLDADDGTESGGFYAEDDGPGIPESERDSVLDVGYTTAEAGTGFGLAIVKEIVDAHQGDVAVGESAEGGARFEITGFD